MTLTTHAIVGAAVAKIFSFNPALAFIVAFLSHFLIDATPHWDYLPKSFQKDLSNKLNSDMVIGKDFLKDFLTILFDAMFGVVLSVLIFSPENTYQFWIVFLGAGFGILPDPLQFVYWKWRHEPFLSLQRFHIWIHSPNESLKNRWKIGIFYQFVLVGVFWLLTKSLFIYIL